MKNIVLIVSLIISLSTFAQSNRDAVDLGLSVKWATHNIGASKPEEFGKYLAWGEIQDKSYYFYDTYKFTNKNVSYQSCIDIGNHIAMTSYDAAHILWKGDWRMPTEKEFIELVQECKWIWTKRNTIPGYKVIGPNGNSIFLPAGGKKFGKIKPELEGCYWSETVNGGIGRTSRSLYFTDKRRDIWGETRISGLLIRPVMGNPNHVAKITEWRNTKYAVLVKHISTENYKEAFNEAYRLSALGDAQVQCVLAAMYLCGAGTTRNYKSAQKFLVKAARQGSARGEYMLGSFGSLKKYYDYTKILMGNEADNIKIDDNSFWYQMMSTETLPKNFKDAFQWFMLKDGEWGYKDIMYYAGIELIKGTYGYQNKNNGLIWIEKSAKLGYGDAIKFMQQITK